MQLPGLVLGGAAWVLASCLAPGLDWQMELGLAGAQLCICLGFTLGWKLEAEGLEVSGDKATLFSVCSQ